MIAFGTLALTTLAMVTWHMRRPNFRDLRISASRFLPDLPQSSAPRTQITISAPLRSLPFWLRLCGYSALLLALLPGFEGTIERPTSAVGLRIILDTSPSMTVFDPQSGVTRLEHAKETARRTLAELRKEHAPKEICDEILGVDALTQTPTGSAEAAIASLQPGTHGATAKQILDALQMVPARPECPLTHSIVFSDLPQPAEVPAMTRVLWHQIGTATPNAALTAARRRGDHFLDQTQTIELLITLFGTMEETPEVTISGPNGPISPQLESDPEADNRIIAYFDLLTSGNFTAMLKSNDAFALDDKVRFSVSSEPPLQVIWNASSLAKPNWLPEAPPGAENTIHIEDLSSVTPESSDTQHKTIYLYDGWSAAATARHIGPFMHEHPLMSGLNFDVFDSIRPNSISPPAAPGFLKTFTSALRPEGGGLPWVALRENPRQVILPMPSNLDANTRNMSWLVFVNSLRWMGEDPERRIPLAWVAPDASIIQNADFESNTAHPMAAAPIHTDFLNTTAVEATKPVPIWPLFLALAALFFLVERVFGLIWRPARGST